MRSIKISALALALPLVLGAQVPDSLNQQGRSMLSFGLGLTGTKTSDVNRGSVSQQATGQVASMTFSHFATPVVAVEISGAVLEGSTSAGFDHVHDEAFMPILFGLSYAPAELAIGSTVRPFLSAAVGPFIHAVNDVSFGHVNDYTETVIGGRVGAGANWFLSRHFILQAEGDYHQVGEFSAVNGVRKNPSGFSMSLGFGFAWGR